MKPMLIVHHQMAQLKHHLPATQQPQPVQQTQHVRYEQIFITNRFIRNEKKHTHIIENQLPWRSNGFCFMNINSDFNQYDHHLIILNYLQCKYIVKNR